MTKKDYELIAGAIRSARRVEDTLDQAIAINRVTVHIARALKAQNARFDTQRFIVAASEVGA